MMTKSLRLVRNIPYYDGLTHADNFFDAFEHEVPKDHRFQALDLALRYTCMMVGYAQG